MMSRISFFLVFACISMLYPALMKAQTGNISVQNLSGFMFTYDSLNHQCKVTKVFTNSNAAKAGIYKGDIFTSVNGNTFAGLAEKDVFKLIKEPGTLSLQVRKDGAEKNVVVEKTSTQVWENLRAEMDTIYKLSGQGFASLKSACSGDLLCPVTNFSTYAEKAELDLVWALPAYMLHFGTYTDRESADAALHTLLNNMELLTGANYITQKAIAGHQTDKRYSIAYYNGVTYYEPFYFVTLHSDGSKYRVTLKINSTEDFNIWYPCAPVADYTSTLDASLQASLTKLVNAAQNEFSGIKGEAVTSEDYFGSYTYHVSTLPILDLYGSIYVEDAMLSGGGPYYSGTQTYTSESGMYTTFNAIYNNLLAALESKSGYYYRFLHYFEKDGYTEIQFSTMDSYGISSNYSILMRANKPREDGTYLLELTVSGS